MEEELQVNTKLCSFNGIIGRRDFFLNFTYINIIATILYIPIFSWIYINALNFSEYINWLNLLAQSPFILQILFVFSSFVVTLLLISNIIRRLNDICGERKLFVQSIFIFPYLLMLLSGVLSTSIVACLLFLIFVLNLFLIFKRGNITKTLPYDVNKEFNWGAFLGTWIWGLFNHSYIPLLQIILGFTPIGFFFALICGLKGNEWAYKNKRCSDVVKFNQSQQNQAIIYWVVFFLITPVFYAIAIFILLGYIISADVDNSPKEKQSFITIEKIMNMLQGFSEIYFEGHEILDDKNIYYVKNSDWQSYAYNEKIDLLDMAASLAAWKRTNIENAKKTSNYRKYYTKSDELPRTKIHSIETKQLLAEFILDDNYSKDSLIDTVKASLNAYRFYKVDENYSPTDADEVLNDETAREKMQTTTNENDDMLLPEQVQNELDNNQSQSEVDDIILHTYPQEEFSENKSQDVEDTRERVKTTREYMANMSKKIKSQWHPGPYDESLSSVVQFKLDDDGTILSASILKTSGNSEYDELSVKTILEFEQFDPLPLEIQESGNKQVDINFTFDYNVFE